MIYNLTTDKNGIAHFKGHPELSAEKSKEILKSLRFSNSFIETVYNIIFLHDMYPDGSKTTVARFCSKYSPDIIRLTLELMRGDTAGKNPEFAAEQLNSYNLAETQIDEIIESKLCLKISDIDINGEDIKAAGFRGKEIGNVLNTILELVIEEQIINEKEILLDAARKLKNN